MFCMLRDFYRLVDRDLYRLDNDILIYKVLLFDISLSFFSQKGKNVNNPRDRPEFIKKKGEGAASCCSQNTVHRHLSKHISGSCKAFLRLAQRDSVKSRCSTGTNNTGGKFATGAAGVVDTCGKWHRCQ